MNNFDRFIEQQQNNMQKQQLKSRKADLKNYQIQAEIGHGASGVCYKAISKLDGSVCAIKKISINTIKGSSLKMALKEVEVLKQLKHPNIIKYYDSFTDDGHLYIVMEYASKGDLHAMLKRRKIKQQFYSEIEIWDMARQLLEALKYLHSKNIVHRDFKTLNIFIGDKNNLLVGDLGVSKIIKNDMGLYSRVGTPLYLAPEIIKYQKYDYKADIWGFGCVMYIVTALCHPFEGKNIINLGQNILYNQPKPIPNFSNQLNTFLKSLLQKNPNKRLDAITLLEQYFSPEAEKLREKYRTERISIKPENIKIENQQKFVKYNTFMEIEKRPERGGTSKYAEEMELRQKKNISKNTNIQQKFIGSDQTIILQPSLIKIDAPQEKTRIRASFNSSKKVGSGWMIQEEKKKDRLTLVQNENQESFRVKSPINTNSYRLKPENDKEKIQTEMPQIVKKQPSSQYFLKHRSIQSAKPRKEQPDSKDGYSSCQKFQKQFVVSSVNRIFFQSQAQNQLKKCPTRPKSSMGRKGLITSNQIKFIKRRNTSEQESMSNTRTQLLRKPEMIII